MYSESREFGEFGEFQMPVKTGPKLMQGQLLFILGNVLPVPNFPNHFVGVRYLSFKKYSFVKY